MLVEIRAWTSLGLRPQVQLAAGPVLVAGRPVESPQKDQ